MKLARYVFTAVVLLLIAVILTSCTEDEDASEPVEVVEQSAKVAEKPAETADKPARASEKPAGPTFIEFDITQSMELIQATSFAEPAQFAVWLEHPETHKYTTIYVSYRSGTGDLVGKAECPGCLPLWFSVYEHETGKMGTPTPDNPAPEAVTSATPLTEHFTVSRPIEPGSKWICWMEVNLAGDFNQYYQEINEEQETIDWDFSGQPPLVYRCEIEAVPGNKYVPELVGIVNMDKPFGEMIEPVSDKITTAKDVFKSIKVRIVQPDPNSAE